MMQLQPEERAIVVAAAGRLGVASEALAEAIEHESAPEVARVLGISEREAERRIEPLRRTVAIGDDWGAGCKLLTDEMRGQVQAALLQLLPNPEHAVVPGDSEG